MFAQDARLKDYLLDAVLTTTDPGDVISDFASIKVHILFEVDYRIEQVSTDELSTVSTYRVTNDGQTLTDLTIRATDPVTGLPASVYLTPQITHIRLETGASLEFKVIPLFGPGQRANGTTGLSPTNNFKLAALQEQAEEDPNAIDYDINGEVNGDTQTLHAKSTCPPGKRIYQVTLRNVVINRPFSSWYCTNRPNIDISVSLPQFLDSSKVLGLMFNLYYSPQSNVLPHDMRVLFNQHEILNMSNQIPQGRIQVPVDPAYLNTTNLLEDSSQLLSMKTVHHNNAHYMSSTGGEMSVAVSEMTVYICASSQEEAEEIARREYEVEPLPETFSVEIINPSATVPVTFEEDGTVKIRAIVNDDNNPYVNMYSVDATVTYLDVSGTPTETFKLHDDGQPVYGDLAADDRYFNVRWLPKHGGDVRLTLTATLPDQRTSTDETSFWVNAFPDLAVTKVYIEPPSLFHNKATIRAEITNLGFTISRPFVVEFRYYRTDENGNKVGDAVHVSRRTMLEPGLFHTTTLNRGDKIEVEDNEFEPNSAWVYFVEVVVDP
jgi:hypothetical protein